MEVCCKYTQVAFNLFLLPSVWSVISSDMSRAVTARGRAPGTEIQPVTAQRAQEEPDATAARLRETNMNPRTDSWNEGKKLHSKNRVRKPSLWSWHIMKSNQIHRKQMRKSSGAAVISKKMFKSNIFKASFLRPQEIFRETKSSGCHSQETSGTVICGLILLFVILLHRLCYIKRNINKMVL